MPEPRSTLRARAAEGAGTLRKLDARLAGNGDEPTLPDLDTDEPTVPDLNTSDIAADANDPVHVAWIKVMRDVQWLGKNRSTTSGAKYSYRGIDDVMNVVGPALRKHGVFVVPAGIEPTFEVIKTSGGSSMNYCRAVAHFTIYGPRGDTMPASVLGEGFDSGDKSGSKAQSVALRTLYLNALAIQTDEPARDTEYGKQYEIETPKPPSAADYFAEITDRLTTIERLRQIREEFARHRDVAETLHDYENERLPLRTILTRVGTARASGGQS